MKDYLKLMRVKHYVKNLLILVPLFFSRNFFDLAKLTNAFVGVICFSLISSAVYILNDLKDIEKDREHPTKKNRPLASGKILPQNALLLMILCVFVSTILSIGINQPLGIIFLAIYFGINIAYSMGLKNQPIIDVVILATGFVIRILYGGFLTGTEISKWLYLVIITGSLYMGLGKRRNELKHQKNTRAVLQFYTEAFLDKNMYVFVALVDVFYALWTIEFNDSRMMWTVPFFFIILVRYSFDIEGNSDGDPVEVLLRDKLLIALVILYAICIYSFLYVFLR